MIRVAVAGVACSAPFWERLAAAQAQAYAGGAAAPYDAASLRALAVAPGGALVVDDPDDPVAFGLGRAVADEGEVLALAVAPRRRRLGFGAVALGALEAALRADGARRLFLEAAADNDAALALYGRAGWREVGRRRGYYHAVDRNRPSTDAILFVKDV